MNLFEIPYFPAEITYADLSKLCPSVPFAKASNFFKNFWTSAKNAVKPSTYKISCVTGKKICVDLEKRLKEFEQGISYSYNDQENFIIEHGKDDKEGYTGFFNTLGKPYFYIAECKKTKLVKKNVKGNEKVFLRKKGEIAAVICCVLRKFKLHDGNTIKAWYVCDLKVGENHRGEHLPTSLIKKGAWRVLQCRRGFGICVDEPNGEMSQSAKIGVQHSLFSSSLGTTSFNQYVLNAKQVTDHFNDIKKETGKELAFTSNEGLKDFQIVNKETGESHPQQLLHMKLSSKEQGVPKLGYDHRISALKDSILDTALKKLGLQPTLTARFISYRMRDFDFSQISSAEI
ncbi:MAG: hypothetical protein ACRDDW_00605 [Candidatus Rhabdochlamydia sp.]